jgi:hypothetical protein
MSMRCGFFAAASEVLPRGDAAGAPLAGAAKSPLPRDPPPA